MLLPEQRPGPRLGQENGRFVWRGTPADRHLPKAAGLHWDPDKQCWWTTDPMAAAKLANFADEEAKAAIDDALVTRHESLDLSRAHDAEVDVPVPEGLALLPFQRAGVAYALGRKATLIADEMGLGKTPQSIAVANATGARSILVVCPLSVKVNWEREIAKWSTADPPLTAGHATAREWPKTDVVVTHYDVLSRHEADLRARQWDMVVLDEAHYLKNPKAQRTQAIFGRKDLPALDAGRKLVLTGTPIPNRPIELYGILRWLGPDIAGSWVRYATRYCAGKQTRYGWDVSGASNLSELQEKLRSTVMVRRRKADVLTELPPKRRQVVPLDPADVEGASEALAAEQEGMAEAVAAREQARVEAELAKASDDPEVYRAAVARLSEAQAVELSEMSRLRHDTAVVKAPAVAAHVADLLESGERKVAVWAHHHDVVGILRDRLAGYGVVEITGETPQDQRQAAVDAFQSPDGPRVFIGSITAAGTGITLTAAQTAVFAELDWVPGNVSQAEDRCFAEGTPVLTPSGWVPIERLSVGDSVISHTGKVRTVTDVWSRGSTREMAELVVSGWPEPLVCTSDHRFLLESGEWREAGALRPGDWLAMAGLASEEDLEKLEFDAGRVPLWFDGPWGRQRNGRLVAAPSVIEVTDDFLFTIGYYIGDGFSSLSRDKGAFVSLAGHAERKSAATARCERWFRSQGVEGVLRYGIGFQAEERFHSRDWATWFTQHCGRVCREKHLPAFVWEISRRQCQVLLNGLVASDGYRRNGRERTEYVTISKTLASQVALLAMHVGYRPSLTQGSTGQWVVAFGKTRGSRTSGRVKKLLLRHPKRQQNGRELVYDISVDNDESFIVGLVAAHNCHRIGQTGSVLIQHVLLDGSLDAKLANTLIAKQEVADKALDRLPDQPWAPPEAFPVPELRPEPPPATAEAPPDRIGQIAARLSEADVALFHGGVRSLAAADWDHAAELNDVGFSKLDTAIGHRLAELDSLTPKQAALAALLCQRYRRQLGETGERASEVVREATAKQASNDGPPAPAAGSGAATPSAP